MKLYRLSTTSAAFARRTAAKVKPYDTKIIAPRRPARQILHPFILLYKWTVDAYLSANVVFTLYGLVYMGENSSIIEEIN
jgi:hypothetical protein